MCDSRQMIFLFWTTTTKTGTSPGIRPLKVNMCESTDQCERSRKPSWRRFLFLVYPTVHNISNTSLDTNLNRTSQPNFVRIYRRQDGTTNWAWNKRQATTWGKYLIILENSFVLFELPDFLIRNGWRLGWSFFEGLSFRPRRGGFLKQRFKWKNPSTIIKTSFTWKDLWKWFLARIKQVTTLRGISHCSTLCTS